MTAIEAPPSERSTSAGRGSAFIDSLLRLVPTNEAGTDRDRSRDRAALAALRRGLGQAPGDIVEMCRYVDPWLSPGVHRDEEEAYYVVASLFGWHPLHRDGPDLGEALARLAQAQREVGIEPTGVERRLVAILDADRDDLSDHLRHAVGLLRSREPSIPIDFAKLLRDVRNWDRPERSVQRRWARSYWGSRGTGEDAADQSDLSRSAAPTDPIEPNSPGA